MLIMYRRIYKEALRQKEAIRRSSVPSQQHLIVDSDRVRSRFQKLQANGFKSKKSSKVPAVKATPPAPEPLPLPPPPTIAISNSQNSTPAIQQNRKKSPPPIIMTTSDSTEKVQKLYDSAELPETETNFSATAENLSPKLFRENAQSSNRPTPTPPPSTPLGPAPAFPGCNPMAPADENEGKATGISGSGTNSLVASTGDSPMRNTLNPNTTTLLGTVQRRLSFANTNIAEGRTCFDMLYRVSYKICHILLSL